MKVPTIINDHREMTLSGYLGEKCFQRLRVVRQNTREVSTGDNNDKVGTSLCGFLAKLNSLASTPCACTSNDGDLFVRTDDVGPSYWYANAKGRGDTGVGTMRLSSWMACFNLCHLSWEDILNVVE